MWTDNINDFIDILRSSGLPMAISPLHNLDLKQTKEDFDRDPENKYGDFKQPHYHVLILFPGPTTYNVVKNLLDPIQCANNPVITYGPVGMYWYHIHRYEGPDKHLYNDSDRTLINGLDKSQFDQLTESQNFELKRFIQELITDYNFVLLDELNKYVDKLFIDDKGNVKDQIEAGFTYQQVKGFIYNNLFFCKSFINDNYQRMQKTKAHNVRQMVEEILKEKEKK